MKVLHVSDVHCYDELLEKVLEDEEYDLVVATGDFECLSTAEKLSKAKAKVLAVTGNSDDPQIADYLEDTGMSVENKVVTFRGLKFAGVSGQDPRTSLKKLIGEEFDVLLTHYPPKGVVDLAWTGNHIGSNSVRKLVEEKEPLVVHCGHVHEARGWDKLGRTIVINSGSLEEGWYAIIDGEKLRIIFKNALGI
ncbi:metallophosphoesterase [Ignicoccus islandicus DSM 13165]|uniref:Metallophosphoesterase n=1 Tax=Ignicoccus islandicus DSM 13165 TaxID=940295 RepID=A0A0U3F8C1_9CREN|nr:metallophosphoesterase family protein [Ignicoccus islandicus]ALU11881.1 metallophosphoesterase [Ignicoccus islandicus DSM 13165]